MQCYDWLIELKASGWFALPLGRVRSLVILTLLVELLRVSQPLK